MAKREYTSYQEEVISRYYENLDSIVLGKLQELVSELYLADSEVKRRRLWERVRKAMEKLQVPAAIYEHILKKKDVTILARNLEDWLKAAKKK